MNTLQNTFNKQPSSSVVSASEDSLDVYASGTIGLDERRLERNKLSWRDLMPIGVRGQRVEEDLMVGLDGGGGGTSVDDVIKETDRRRWEE